MYGDIPEPAEENDEEQFHSIVYMPSGYTEGVRVSKLSDLAEHWIDFWCRAFRDIDYYDQKLPAPFDAVRLRYHTDGNFAVADFFYHGVFFSTSVLLRGRDPAEEQTLLKSLVGVARERQAQEGLKKTAFKEVLKAKERPLHAVFVWTYQRDERWEMVPELTNHLAGAFMKRFES